MDEQVLSLGPFPAHAHPRINRESRPNRIAGVAVHPRTCHLILIVGTPLALSGMRRGENTTLTPSSGDIRSSFCSSRSRLPELPDGLQSEPLLHRDGS